IPIIHSLRILGKTGANAHFRETIASIASSIEQGSGLTDSFKNHSTYFNDAFLGLLRSGEISGKLDTVLNYAADMAERSMIHRQRIKATLLYPKIVAGMILITMMVILTFVVPQFSKLFAKF